MINTPIVATIARFVYRILVSCGIWYLCVTAGKAFSWLLPIHNRSKLFFFFPFYHIGGAERIHADISTCFANDQPWIIFTRRSKNDGFKRLFPSLCRIFTLWPMGYLFPFSIGIAAGLINRHRGAVVFGSNSSFYYRLIPYLAPHVRKTDLTHAFDGLEDLSLTVAPLLDARIVITDHTRTGFEHQYKAHGLDERLLDRVVHIPNRIEVPLSMPYKNYSGTLRVVFVGRGTTEKRAHLVGRIAALCKRDGLDTEFCLVGDIVDAVELEDRNACKFIGTVTDPVEMARIYDNAHLLVLVSSREGFPLVIMEAMAHGVVPISTNVGGIARHLRDGENGVLINETDEEMIVVEVRHAIKSLCDRKLLTRLSRAAHAYALEEFSAPDFCRRYRAVVYGPEQLPWRG